jgi:hypothetical protein
MNIARLEYENKRGFYMETGHPARLAKKLETIRCNADLWSLDEQGVKIDIIGGCEPANAPDDKRIKWNWWYDKTACGIS